MPGESVRIDKWLWAARMFKTRTAATTACDGGHVRVNDLAVKPSGKVKVGDTIEAVTPRGEVVLLVQALGERRGPASVAAALYEDQTPPPPPEEIAIPPVLRDRGAGRPTKKDRRSIDKLRDL